MMPKLAVRTVSIGVLVFVGLLPASPTDTPKVPAGIGKKEKPEAKADDPKPLPGPVDVSIDAAGFATFTHKCTGVMNGRVLIFRANDFDDAVRSLKVSGDNVSLAKGSVHPLLSILRDKKAKDALPGVQLTELLDSLRGQQVTVSPDGTAANAKPGTLLSVDSFGGQSNQASGTTPATPSASKTITLWSKDAGVFMVALSPTTTIKFADAGITNKVQEALVELARGNGQFPRSVAVRLKGDSTITYTHPIAPWDIQYILNLDTKASDPKAPADPKAPVMPTATLSGRVTVRNSTAQAWNNIDISLTGLPWSGSPGVKNVTLQPDQVATFTVSPPRTVALSVTDDSLTFANQQTTSPNPDRKFTLAAPPGALATIPGPITVVEDGIVAGQATSLDFTGTDGASVTLSPYNLVTVSQSAPKAAAPILISFADGLLRYTTTQTTTFRLTNRSKSDKTLAVTAQAGWKGPAEPNDSIGIPAGTAATPVPFSFVETRAAQVVAVASLSPVQLAALRKSVSTAVGYDDLRSLLDQVKAQLDIASNLDGERQALALGIGAIAARQPKGQSVIALQLPQLAQDEAKVAGLRQRMDLLTARKAEVLRRLEEYAEGLPAFTIAPPAP